VVIAGGSGFIGRALAGELANRGYEVVILTRSPAGDNEVQWDGRTIDEWVRQLDGTGAIVNLAGKNVNCRYTRKNLAEIDESRENSVRVIGQAISRCSRPPKVWVQASTTAIYGDAGDRWCDECTPPGEGIPVDTATRWERAFDATPSPQTRRVILRMSFVLGRTGGVLKMLAMLTRCFLGGSVGGGRQYISWIHIDDLMRMFVRAIEDESIAGVFVATGPTPVTNAQFMRSLRRALHRPWSPPTPAWAVHVGSFFLRTEPVLALTGRRVMPKRWLDGGFRFRFPKLDVALQDLLSSGLGDSPKRSGETPEPPVMNAAK
jgi:uncharacterized protein (TIGR01777 family)